MSTTKMTYRHIRRIAHTAGLEAERLLLRASLHANAWGLAATARVLSCRVSTLQKALARHPELRAEYARRNPGPGRIPGKRP